MRILVVGLGQIAQRHIRNLKALEPDTTIAVWRQRPDPPEWHPPEGLLVDRWLYEWDDVLRWHPSIGIIANPASDHVGVAIGLGDYCGAHLFVEKPISDRQGCRLDAIVKTTHRVLMVGYDLRFYRPLQLVKAAIDAGRIGRPMSIHCEVGQYLPDWRPGRDYRQSVSAQASLGGGVLLELSHEIDYARWLMGEVATVSAHYGKLSDLEIDVEDTADVLLRFERGAMGSIHLDMTDRQAVRWCRVVGTEGSIACGIRTGQVDLFHGGDDLRWDVLHEGLTVTPDPMLAEMRHFLACCRGEAVPPVDGRDAARTLAVALAAKRSAEEGKEICL